MGEIEEFFAKVGKIGHQKLLERASGTVLVEVKEGNEVEHWYVTVKRGDLSVSRRGENPDCTLKTDDSTLKAILRGEVNAAAAMLRGLLEVEGKISLLVALQALFRPSPGALDQSVAGYAKEQS
jgi:putative sterol carrier protein